MTYFVLFLEGFITFISPCLLPMLPIYVSYFAAGDGTKKTVLSNALAFVLGFTSIFVLMGAFAGSVGSFILRYQTAFNWISGIIVILFGLNFLGVIRIPFLNRTSDREVPTGQMNVLSAALFGVVFSIAWTPCVGAFLGTALMQASHSGSLLTGIYMLLAYSAGLGIPFVLSALLIDQLRSTFNWIKRNYKLINAISGGLLILVGLLMITGLMGRLLTFLSV